MVTEVFLRRRRPKNERPKAATARSDLGSPLSSRMGQEAGNSARSEKTRSGRRVRYAAKTSAYSVRTQLTTSQSSSTRLTNRHRLEQGKRTTQLKPTRRTFRV